MGTILTLPSIELMKLNQSIKTKFIGANKMLLVYEVIKVLPREEFIFHDKLRLTLYIIVDYETFNLTLL